MYILLDFSFTTLIDLKIEKVAKFMLLAFTRVIKSQLKLVLVSTRIWPSHFHARTPFRVHCNFSCLLARTEKMNNQEIRLPLGYFTLSNTVKMRFRWNFFGLYMEFISFYQFTKIIFYTNLNFRQKKRRWELLIFHSYSTVNFYHYLAVKNSETGSCNFQKYGKKRTRQEDYFPSYYKWAKDHWANQVEDSRHKLRARLSRNRSHISTDHWVWW